MEGLQARVYRTYPSLIRDLHFCLFMKEKALLRSNAIVIYNIDLDIEEGIDILLEFKDKLYGINLYTNTSRAIHARTLKSKRHNPFQNVNYVELPVPFKGSKEVGQFFLYGERELNGLRNLIRKNK
jgi:hypothetical protein